MVIDAIVDSYDETKQRYKCKAVYPRNPTPVDQTPAGVVDYLETTLDEYDKDRSVEEPVYAYAANLYELVGYSSEEEDDILVHRGGAVPAGTYVRITQDRNWEWVFKTDMDFTVEIQDSPTVILADKRWSYKYKIVQPIGFGTVEQVAALDQDSDGFSECFNWNETNNAATGIVGTGADFDSEPLLSSPGQLLQPIRGLPVTTMQRRMSFVSGLLVPTYWIDLPNIVQGPCDE